MYFSIGGRHFGENPVEYIYMPDVVLERARNVSIHFDPRLARYVKLQFTFASEWLLISEVYFHSGIY